MRGSRGHEARTEEWDRDQFRQGLTAGGRAQRRAAIASKASRAAANPVAGPYMFGELAAFLDSIGQLHNLSVVVTAAEEYGQRTRELQEHDAQAAEASQGEPEAVAVPERPAGHEAA